MVLLFFIIFGEDGVVDLRALRQERILILEKNKILQLENMEKYREVHRLENDLTYIGEVARKELGMVRGDEVIIKPKRQ